MLAPNVRIIEPASKQLRDNVANMKRKRVCAYCRVSTNSPEQETSYENQLKHYTEVIQRNPEWEFIGIYADKGISGTCLRKRKEFLRMMDDCRAGKIDLILTKSTSRWARWTTDSLNTVEELKQLGIGVQFESNGINSLDNSESTRMRLIMDSATDQNYSEGLSASVKWGNIRNIERGIYNCQAVYGYRECGERQIAIYEPEAEVVRRIFRLYLDGYSYQQIVNDLNNDGIIAPGKKKWNHSQIERMLVNEKYVGDLHLLKTTTSDLKTRRRIKNVDGKQYYIDNHHAPIVSREVWDRVKREHEYRANQRGFGKTGRSVYTSQYAFSNKVYCLECGSKFRRHYYETKNGKVYTWVCINHKQKGNCNQLPVTEKSLEDAFLRIINNYIEDKAEFIEQIIQPIKEVLQQRNTEQDLKDIENQIAEMQRTLTELIHSSTLGTLGTAQQLNEMMIKLENLQKDKSEKTLKLERQKKDLIRLDEMQDYITEKSVFETFDTYTFKRLVERVLISDNKATFVFNDSFRVDEDLI